MQIIQFIQNASLSKEQQYILNLTDLYLSGHKKKKSGSCILSLYNLICSIYKLGWRISDEGPYAVTRMK